jgi:hypothetical protein
MPDARYMGRVPLTLRPGDSLCLGLECLEHAIPLFLDDIVSTIAVPSRRPLGRASMKTVIMFLSPIVSIEASIAQSQRLQQLRTTCRRAQRPPGAPSAWGRATFHCAPPRRSSSAARRRNDVRHQDRRRDSARARPPKLSGTRKVSPGEHGTRCSAGPDAAPTSCAFIRSAPPASRPTASRGPRSPITTRLIAAAGTRSGWAHCKVSAAMFPRRRHQPRPRHEHCGQLVAGDMPAKFIRSRRPLVADQQRNRLRGDPVRTDLGDGERLTRRGGVMAGLTKRNWRWATLRTSCAVVGNVPPMSGESHAEASLGSKLAASANTMPRISPSRKPISPHVRSTS